MDEPIARMQHVRELGFCARGAREFFARHGWDWPDFLANGIPCSTLEATGDSLAISLAHRAREAA